MLISLNVRNYALIDSLEWRPGASFSVITGETGAGKSILLGALGLVSGERSDTSVIGNRNDKCVVEAIFDIKAYRLAEFFEMHELDYMDNCCLRREIASTGKSRSFINDTPVTLSVIKDLSRYLLDIHSQHDAIELNDPAYQLNFIDWMAGNEKVLQAYHELFKHYRSQVKKIMELKAQNSSWMKERDYQQFIYDELIQAGLHAGNFSAYREELRLLSHVTEIGLACEKALNILESDEQSLIKGLNSLRQSLQLLQRFRPEAEEWLKRIETVKIELKDVSSAIEDIYEHTENNPSREEWLNEEISKLERLFKKHHVNSEEELLEILHKLDASLQQGNNLEAELHLLEKESEITRKKLVEAGEVLSGLRQKCIPVFCREVATVLKDLGMPSARFNINMMQHTEPAENGLDAVEFMFSSNKGHEPASLGKTASGGELSRIMLSIKSVTSQRRKLPSIIFDEIDTGVSGETAHKMGLIMHKMSEKMQVVAITHLPQIAGKADEHWWVYKTESTNKTQTRIRKLEAEERVMEVARMLSSNQPGDAAIGNARELLGLADKN